MVASLSFTGGGNDDNQGGDSNVDSNNIYNQIIFNNCLVVPELFHTFAADW